MYLLPKCAIFSRQDSNFAYFYQEMKKTYNRKKSEWINVSFKCKLQLCRKTE